MPTVNVTVTDKVGHTATGTVNVAVNAASAPPVLSNANMPHVVGTALVYYAGGVPQSQPLTAQADLTTSANGQIIEGRDINGQVTVNHSNVLIRRCRIRNGYFYCIYNAGQGVLTVEDCEIVGPTGSSGAAAIGFTNLKLSRVNFHDSNCDGIKFGNGFVGDMLWLHDFHPVAGAHADCFQTTGSGSSGTFVLKNSHIDPREAGTFGLQLGDESAAIGSITIDNCRFGANHKPIGGGYPPAHTNGDPNPYIIRNCVFDRPWNTGTKPVINYTLAHMQQSNNRDGSGVPIVL